MDKPFAIDLGVITLDWLRREEAHLLGARRAGHTDCAFELRMPSGDPPALAPSSAEGPAIRPAEPGQDPKAPRAD